MNIIKLYVDDNLTIREIAVKINKSYEYVRKYLKNNNVEWKRNYSSNFSHQQINSIINEFDNHTSIKNISKQNNISPNAISKLLKKNNRFPISSIHKYDHLREIPLNQIQKELLIGHLLGDGCAFNENDGLYKIEISHKIEHKDYFFYKINLLSPFITSWRISKRKDGEDYQATTICHSEFQYYENIFYNNRIKFVPNNIKELTTPLSLAIWIMDDGNLNKVNLRLATMSFTYEDHLLLKQMLQEKFSITSKISDFKYKGKHYFQLTLDKENTILISNITRPYIIEQMKYKFINI